MTGPLRSSSSRANCHKTTPYTRSRPTPSAATPPTASNATLLEEDQSSLPTVARQVTCMVAMFWSPRDALNAYPDLQQVIEDGSEETLRATASLANRISYDVCDELERIHPNFFERLDGKGGDSRRQVRKELSEGQSGAKAEDNNKVKNAIVHWRKWSPPLVHELKTIRGLAHLECARLLAPITVDWDNEEEQHDNGDPTQPSKGLLQGQLLVNTARAILESPSSVLPSTSARPNVLKQGRKGIAHKYQFGVVTPAFLAYAAVVLRFSLSSEPHFSDTGGTFNYIDFYTQVRRYLEAPKYQKTNKILLAWWNKKIFPNSLQANSAAGFDEPTGMLSLLDAEIEREESDPEGSEDED